MDDQAMISSVSFEWETIILQANANFIKSGK